VRWMVKRRAGVACILMAIIFTGFSARLIYLQVGQHEEYTRIAAQKHSSRKIIPAERGLI